MKTLFLLLLTMLQVACGLDQSSQLNQDDEVVELKLHYDDHSAILNKKFNLSGKCYTGSKIVYESPEGLNIDQSHTFAQCHRGNYFYLRGEVQQNGDYPIRISQTLSDGTVHEVKKTIRVYALENVKSVKLNKDEYLPHSTIQGNLLFLSGYKIAYVFNLEDPQNPRLLARFVATSDPRGGDINLLMIPAERYVYVYRADAGEYNNLPRPVYLDIHDMQSPTPMKAIKRISGVHLRYKAGYRNHEFEDFDQQPTFIMAKSHKIGNVLYLQNHSYDFLRYHLTRMTMGLDIRDPLNPREISFGLQEPTQGKILGSTSEFVGQYVVSYSEDDQKRKSVIVHKADANQVIWPIVRTFTFDDPITKLHYSGGKTNLSRNLVKDLQNPDRFIYTISNEFVYTIDVTNLQAIKKEKYRERFSDYSNNKFEQIPNNISFYGGLYFFNNSEHGLTYDYRAAGFARYEYEDSYGHIGGEDQYHPIAYNGYLYTLDYDRILNVYSCLPGAQCGK